MKIKVNIIVLILTAFILTINHNSYADISIDDMGFLLEDDAGNAKENDVANDNKEALDGNVVTVVEKRVKKSKLTAKSVSNKAADILHHNSVIVIAVGVCSLFFIVILYIFYVKIKKLSEQAQVSKDLAEKYFYNLQEHRKERLKIGEVADAKASEIDTEISDIITSVKKAFDEETEPDDKPDEMDDADNGVDNSDLVTGSEEMQDVDSKESIVDQKELDDEDKDGEEIPEKLPEIEVPETNTIDNIDNLDILKMTEDQNEINDISEAADSSDTNSDDKEKIVDQKNLDNKDKDEEKDEEKVLKKPPEIAVPETNPLLDNLDIPEMAEEQKQMNDIDKTVDSPNTTNALDKDNKGDELDVSESLHAVGEPEALSKEKEEDLDTSGDDESNDVGLDIDDILKMETEDEKKDGKK